MNPLTQERIRVYNQTYIDSHTVCELLHQIAALGLAAPITLVLDNAAYQACLVRCLAQQLNIESGERCHRPGSLIDATI